MRISLLALALALGASTATAGPPESVDPAAIPAYRLLHPGLAAAGQPTPAALAGLREMGFRTVVNLRAEKEGPADERAVVEAQGLRYVSIPVTTDTFSLADVEALEKVLNDPTGRPGAPPLRVLEPRRSGLGRDPGPQGQEPGRGRGGRSGGGPAQPADGGGRETRSRRARPPPAPPPVNP